MPMKDNKPNEKMTMCDQHAYLSQINKEYFNCCLLFDCLRLTTLITILYVSIYLFLNY